MPTIASGFVPVQSIIGRVGISTLRGPMIAFTPISASGALGTLLDLNPIAAFMRGLGITAGGGGLPDITVPVAIMLGFAAVMAVLSQVIPDRGVVS